MDIRHNPGCERRSWPDSSRLAPKPQLTPSATMRIAGLSGDVSRHLRGSGVTLHLVRPGFVHTKMTRGRPAAPLAVGPELVASDIVRGLKEGRTLIWSPRILGLVFPGLRLAPRRGLRRLPG